MLPPDFASLIRATAEAIKHPLPRRPCARRDPYTRGLSFRRCSSRLPSPQTPVVMGPCVRRDDEIAAPPSSNFQTAPSTHASAPPATRSARVVHEPCAQEGVGNAGCSCTRSLACRKVTRELVTTDTPETPGIPARNGFNGFLRALPGDRAFLPPSSTDHSVNLTPASGRQDHTTSPSAGQRIRQSAARVHRIPPRVRDDREPPLCGTRRHGISR